MSNEEKLELAKELEQYTKEEMIEKYIDELEENCTLSDLWYKSQNIIKEVREYIEEAQERDENKESCSLYIPKLLEILDKENK